MIRNKLKNLSKTWTVKGRFFLFHAQTKGLLRDFIKAGEAFHTKSAQRFNERGQPEDGKKEEVLIHKHHKHKEYHEPNTGFHCIPG